MAELISISRLDNWRNEPNTESGIIITRPESKQKKREKNLISELREKYKKAFFGFVKLWG